MNIVELAVNNGLGVLSFIVMIYYIFEDKKTTREERNNEKQFIMKLTESLNQNTYVLNQLQNTQKEITDSLNRITYRLENIEGKIQE